MVPGMGRAAEYRAELRALPPELWDGFLAERSGLPGPRGNVELAAAVAEEATLDVASRYAASDDEYQALCGAFAYGRLLAEGHEPAATSLYILAQDERWRVREGVAMGLQRLGDVAPERLVRIVRDWARDGHPLVHRAAAAAICEPRLLRHPATAHAALDVLDAVTAGLAALESEDRRDDGVKALRKALGYCWSVAVAAAPEPGFARLERWAGEADRDVRWIVRENLRKTRLHKADPARAAALQSLNP